MKNDLTYLRHILEFLIFSLPFHGRFLFRHSRIVVSGNPFTQYDIHMTIYEYVIARSVF